jgi:hypothetical protein
MSESNPRSRYSASKSSQVLLESCHLRCGTELGDQTTGLGDDTVVPRRQIEDFASCDGLVDPSRFPMVHDPSIT